MIRVGELRREGGAVLVMVKGACCVGIVPELRNGVCEFNSNRAVTYVRIFGHHVGNTGRWV